MKQPLRIQLSGSPGGTDNYALAMRNLGAQPVPGYAPEPDLSCEGLILCGGGDINPALFGQTNQGSQTPDPTRDRAELALVQAFVQAGKPILGICRGMQMINVALGGSLVQDLPPETVVFHRGKRDTIHPVRTTRDSLMHQLYGEVCFVNSSHHQAVGRLGNGLFATAWAEGGFPEALEHNTLPIFATQFHPERMAFAFRQAGTADGGLLLGRFVSVCRSRALC